MNVAPFVESPIDVVRKMLQLVEPKPDEILYDLGSGNGRILITAAKEFHLHCVGIEIRQDLFKKAIDEIKWLNLESRIKMINEDFFNVNISNADIVTLYLTTLANEKLRPKLE
ncbi:MAG: class I SAM-dependent methyltransferase, partial [archaeon]|nr:class I SAM-dependent methyltransferase [archaeon]